MRLVTWVAAVSHVRGRHHPRCSSAADPLDGGSPNANGYTQDRDLTEVYGEAHHRFAPLEKLGLTAGADVLFGEGKQSSHNFQYYAPLNGNPTQSSGDGTPVEDTEFEAERLFFRSVRRGGLASGPALDHPRRRALQQRRRNA